MGLKFVKAGAPNLKSEVMGAGSEAGEIGGAEIEILNRQGRGVNILHRRRRGLALKCKIGGKRGGGMLWAPESQIKSAGKGRQI